MRTRATGELAGLWRGPAQGVACEALPASAGAGPLGERAVRRWGAGCWLTGCTPPNTRRRQLARRVPHQLAITLRNVAKRALTAADFQDARGKDWTMQFRLVIGLRALA